MGISSTLAAAESFSGAANTKKAAAEVAESVLGQLGQSPDLGVVFFTPQHREQVSDLHREIQGRLGPDVLIGCSSSGTIGAGQEHQVGPGISLWAACAPGARVQSFHLSLTEMEGGGFVRGWPDVGPEASVILLVDPFGFPLDPFLSSLRKGGKYPTLIGGLASGANRFGGNLLIENDHVVSSGAVGFVIDGAARFQPLVSQGCRPIGQPLRVTRSQKNIVLELNGAPACELFNQTMGSLEEDERLRFSRAPHVGIHEGGEEYEGGAGSFRVRGIMGLDNQEGSMAIADFVNEGMVLQFHTKDGEAAHDDLNQILGLATGFYPSPAGALMFACAGRGLPLFGRSDHDIALIQSHYPKLPVSGMFAAGEIGPCGGQPFIHGFAVTAGLLVPQEGEFHPY